MSSGTENMYLADAKGCPKGHWVNEIDEAIVPHTIPIHFVTGNGHNKIVVVVVVVIPLEFWVPRQRGSALSVLPST